MMVASSTPIPAWLSRAWPGVPEHLHCRLRFREPPALYGGDNADAFYTANGIVTIVALLPLYGWTLAISIAILRKAA
jgi:hypothetical protein